MDNAAKLTGRMLGRAVKSVRHQIQARTQPQLGPTQMRVLNELTQANGLSMQQLSRRTGLSPGALSEVVEQLQSQKLVRGEPGAASGLARVFLSEALSLYLMRSPSSRLIAPVLRAFQGVSPDEQTQLLRKLDSLRPRAQPPAAPRPAMPRDPNATRAEDI